MGRRGYPYQFRQRAIALIEAGRRVAELADELGVSRETIYTWRRKFAGVDVKEAKRLRELERENGRLKKILVERDLEIEVMKEIAAKKW